MRRAAATLMALVLLLSAGCGYYLSFAWEFSAGASMVGCAAVLLLIAWIAGRARR